jgi:hypothetical protein
MARNNGTANTANTANTASELVPLETQTFEGENYETSLMIPESANTIATSEYQSFMALARNLDQMNPTFSISSKYFEFTQPGQSVRGIYLGMTYIQCKDDRTGELKPLQAVSWLAQDGTMFINSGAAFVSAFRQFEPPKGCPVEITFEGKKDRTKLYNVRILVA